MSNQRGNMVIAMVGIGLAIVALLLFVIFGPYGPEWW